MPALPGYPGRPSSPVLPGGPGRPSPPPGPDIKYKLRIFHQWECAKNSTANCITKYYQALRGLPAGQWARVDTDDSRHSEGSHVLTFQHLHFSNLPGRWQPAAQRPAVQGPRRVRASRAVRLRPAFRAVRAALAGTDSPRYKLKKKHKLRITPWPFFKYALGWVFWVYFGFGGDQKF